MAALRNTDLEWTTFYVGQIMDHLGTPHLKSHMGVYSIHIDMANKVASIPGSGNEVTSFTYSFDIARFVKAALDLPQWDNEMFCYSDNRTYNEVLKLAEEARGSCASIPQDERMLTSLYTGSKFAMTYDDVEKLEKGEMTELPFHRTIYERIPKPALQKRYASFGLYTVKGLMNLPKEKCLNKMFPKIKTTTVKDVVGAWKGK